MPSPRARFLLLLLAVFLGLVAAETRFLHLTEAFSNRVADFFLRQHAKGLAADPDIVILAIDEASVTGMAGYAGRWPWPRSVHGEVVEGIAAQKPKAIVFDVMFGEPDVFRPESDAAFNEAIAPLANVYFPTARHDPGGDAYGVPIKDIAPGFGAVRGLRSDPKAKIDVLLPLALKPGNWRLGLINFLQDRDGVGRRYLIFENAYGWRLPSLPARLAIDLGWPLPGDDDFMIGWRGGVRAGLPDGAGGAGNDEGCVRRGHGRRGRPVDPDRRDPGGTGGDDRPEHDAGHIHALGQFQAFVKRFSACERHCG